MTVLEEIGSLLVAAGIGVLGSSLFYTGFPIGAAVDGVTIEALDSGADVFTAGAGSLGRPAIEHPKFRVTARSSTQRGAWLKATACRDALRWFDGTLGSAVYHNITMVSGPTEIGPPSGEWFAVRCEFEGTRSE